MLGPVDIETAYVDLLDALTHDPARRVSRTGGPGPLNVVQSAVRLLVECYGPDSVAAFDNAREAWGLIWANQRTSVGGIWIARVELTEPVNNPDPASDSDRYQFIAQPTVSLQEIA